MELHVLTGDDTWLVDRKIRGILADAGSPLRIDVSEDGGDSLLDAVEIPSLFDPRRVVLASGIESLTESNRARLTAAATGSDALVVARSTSALAPKLRAALVKIGEVTHHPAPRGAAVAGRVDELAREAGVRLDATARRVLAERAAEDLPRAAAVVGQLRAAGIQAASARQVEMLLGSTQPAGVHWRVTDALLAGAVGRALADADGVEPLALVGYVGSVLEQATAALETGGPDVALDDAALMAATGVKHPFQARKVRELARRLGPVGAARCWHLVTEADRACKGGTDPHVAVDLLLADLAAEWGPRSAAGGPGSL